jgi:hypothetical protein
MTPSQSGKAMSEGELKDGHHRHCNYLDGDACSCGVEVEQLRASLAAVSAERDRLRSLLEEASRRIWEHHADGFKAIVGNVCSVCKGPDLFVRIESALSPSAPAKETP